MSMRTYKSTWRILGNVLAVALGSINFGYCMAYISPFLKYEHQQRLIALIVGTIPLGAAVGALISFIFISKCTRRHSLILAADICILGSSLTLIRGEWSIYVGRSIQGISVGIYSSIVPLFINELCPVELAHYKLLNQLSIVVGTLFSWIIAEFIIGQNPFWIYEDPFWIYDLQDYSVWSIVFGFPIALSALQIFLFLFIYKNQTPRYLIIVDRDNEAKTLIQQLYREEYVQDIVEEKTSQVVTFMIGRKNSIINSTNNCFSMVSSPKAKKLCLVVACTVSFLQQISGINVVVLYGQYLISFGFLRYFNLLYIIEFIGCLASFQLLKKYTRKNLLQFGAISTCILSAVAGFSFMNQNLRTLAFISMLVFMLIFGFTLGPLCWLYPPEILPLNQVPWSTFVNWIGASLTIILFPILDSVLNAWFSVLLFDFLLLFYLLLSEKISC